MIKLFDKTEYRVVKQKIKTKEVKKNSWFIVRDDSSVIHYFVYASEFSLKSIPNRNMGCVTIFVCTCCIDEREKMHCTSKNSSINLDPCHLSHSVGAFFFFNIPLLLFCAQALENRIDRLQCVVFSYIIMISRVADRTPAKHQQNHTTAR